MITRRDGRLTSSNESENQDRRGVLGKSATDLHARVDEEGCDEDWPTTVDLTGDEAKGARDQFPRVSSRVRGRKENKPQRSPNERSDTVPSDEDGDQKSRDLSTEAEVDDHLRNHTRGSCRSRAGSRNVSSSTRRKGLNETRRDEPEEANVAFKTRVPPKAVSIHR